MKLINAFLAWVKSIMGKLGKGNQFPIDVPTISLALSTVSVNEGNTLVVNLTRTGNTSYTSTCYLYTIAGTAKETDYTPHNGTLVTFNPGDTSKQENILIATDAINEADEVFIVQIANQNLAVIGVNKCVVTITGSTVPDLIVTGITNSSVDEGGNNVHTITFSSSVAGTVPFSVANVTTSSGDIILPPTFSNGATLLAGVLTKPDGVNSLTATIATVQDALVEPNETYTITAGAQSATGTVVNDDSLPASTVVSISSVTVVEGASATLTINLSGPSIGQSFAATFGGSATAGVDYSTFSFNNGVTMNGGNVLFPAGVSSCNAFTTTVDDAVSEFTETISLTLAGITGTINITDNDAVTLTPLTAVAAFEQPNEILTSGQVAATSGANSGGYFAFAASRNILSSTGYAVWMATTEGGTYTKILDNQPYVGSALLQGLYDLTHTNLQILDEVNFPTTIAADTVAMLYDTAGKKEFVVLGGLPTLETLEGTSAKTFKDVGIGAYYTQPMVIEHDELTRLYFISSAAKDTVLRANGTYFFKLAPIAADGSSLDLSLITPISLTIQSMASRPNPPALAGYAVQGNNFKYLTTQEVTGEFSDGLFVGVGYKNRLTTPAGSFFKPSATLEAGVTYELDVPDTLGGVARTIVWESANKYIKYLKADRLTDGARYTTTYMVYAKKGGIRSIGYPLVVNQVITRQNEVTAVALANVAGATGSVYDNFTAADNASSLNGRVTSDGTATWSVLGGTAGIRNNAAYFSAGGGVDANIAVVNANKDGKLTFTISALTKDIHHILRASDGLNYYGYVTTNSSSQLYKNEAGVQSFLHSYGNYTNGDVIEFEVTSANVFTIKRNGTVDKTTPAQTFNATANKAGFRTFSSVEELNEFNFVSSASASPPKINATITLNTTTPQVSPALQERVVVLVQLTGTLFANVDMSAITTNANANLFEYNTATGEAYFECAGDTQSFVANFPYASSSSSGKTLTIAAGGDQFITQSITV